MIPDGVYINMSFDAYLSDPALGSGDLKDILASAVQWNAEHRNPEWTDLQQFHMSEREREKAALEGAGVRFGRALHAMVLEPGEFEARYLAEPEAPAWPKTKDQMAEALLAKGLLAPKMTEKSAVFVSACRAADVRIADDWAEELERMAAGRERISPKWFMLLKMLDRAMSRHSTARGFVTGGLAEVSVFWTDETGLRLKCRFDYLRIKAVCDVKTFAWRPGGGTVIDQFIRAVDTYAYDLSAAHYMDCRTNVLPGLVEAGRVYEGPRVSERGELETDTARAEDQAFLRKVAAYEKPQWVWLAALTNAYPEVHPVVFPDGLLAFQSAQVQVEDAKRIYREFSAKFSDGEPWANDEGTIILNDMCMGNRRARDRGAKMYDTV